MVDWLEKLSCALTAVFWTIGVAFWCTVGYVAYHFVTKFW